jgi:hypothetical protein
MKKSRFTEEQIAYTLQQAVLGTAAADHLRYREVYELVLIAAR